MGIVQFIWLKRILTWFQECFQSNVELDGLSNAQIRTKWEKKKNYLRLGFSLIISLLIFIGLELATPNYSFTGILATKIFSFSSLKDCADNVSQLTVYKKFIGDRGIVETFPNLIKIGIIVFCYLFVTLYFFGSDPMSDPELLRNLALDDSPPNKRLLVRFHRELQFYARQVPSNRLPERCLSCANTPCQNRLLPAREDKTLRWYTFFAKLSPLHVNALHRSVFLCRLVFYSRFAFWLAAMVLVPIYFVARFLEYFLFNLQVNSNLELIGYIGFLGSVWLVIGQLNQADESNNRGMWGHLKETISFMISSEPYDVIFDTVVCKHKGLDFSFTCRSSRRTFFDSTASPIKSGWDIQTLFTLLDYLDTVVQKKLKTILSQSVSSSSSDVSPVRNLLLAVTSLYSALYNNQHSFRAALFVPNGEDTHLVPLAKAPLPDRPFVTLQTESEFARHFSKQSGSVVSQAWTAYKPICMSGNSIPFFHDEQPQYLKSIVAVPLIIPEDILALCTKNGLDFPTTIGVICLDCDSADVFSQDRCLMNEIIIKPFCTRIVFELIHQALKTQKKEVTYNHGKED